MNIEKSNKRSRKNQPTTGGFAQVGAQSRATIQRDIVSLRPCRAVVETPTCKRSRFYVGRKRRTVQRDNEERKFTLNE